MRRKIIHLICLALLARMVFVPVVFADNSTPSNKAEIKSKINWCRGLIQNSPNDPRVYGEMAFWLLEDGQYDQAIATAKRAITLDPLYSVTYHNLGWSYYKKGEYKKALLSLKKAVEIEEGGKADLRLDNTYSAVAQVYFKLRDYKEAACFFKKALAMAPHNRNYLSWMALTYYYLGEYKSALWQINRLIEQSKYVGVGMRIGPGTPFPKIAEVFEGKPAEKAGAMAGDEVIKVNGMSMKNKNVGQAVKRLMGRKGTRVKVLVRRQKRKYNLVMVRDIISLPDSQKSAKMLSKRSLIYRKMGEHDKAMLDAEQAFKMAPDYLRARKAFGAANLDAGNYEQAIEILSGADQEDVFVLLLTAAAYAKQGDFKKAMQLYEEKISGDESLLKIIPYISEEQELFDALEPELERILSRARQFEDKGRFQEALDEYSRAILFMAEERKGQIRDKLFEIVSRMSELPRMSEIAHKHSVRAEALVQKGKLKDAIAEFKKAINSAPFIARLYFNTALVYAQIEDYPQAIRYMNIYVQAAPEAPDVRAAKDEIIKWELELEQKDE